MITEFAITQWTEAPSPTIQSSLIDELEQGRVLLFNQLPFELKDHEKTFLTPHIITTKKRKNISYDTNTRNIKGSDNILVAQMMERFSTSATLLVNNLFPHYKNHIKIGRTSFRPVEIATRAPLSGSKDDRLLHVDAFPATPVAGKRILRLFSNIHPNNGTRDWRLGKSLDEAMEKFIPEIKKPIPGLRKLKQLFNITRGYQTLYDHYMLNLHNTMKANGAYQQQYPQIYAMPAQSTWMVFTDVAPHAAMGGQHLLEQTFYLPPENMAFPERSPLKKLEKFIGEKLV
ncbi:MAG TPA: Kdo hydroxylase family protein [Gammaproteobacteria bacterium]|nr:Kdo hydroxylase family protein [Gammaproteobacteria bacterium]